MGPVFLAATALATLGAPAAAPCGDSYTVVRHDTLYSIARRCGLPVGHVARANRIDPTRIAVGQRLVLPYGHGGAGKPDGEEGGGHGGLSYRFQRGDTLYSLARWARVSLRALLAANPGIDPHQIEIDDMICLPRGAVAPDAARMRERGPHAMPSPPRVHVAPPRPQPHHAAQPPPRQESRDDDHGHGNEAHEDKPGGRESRHDEDDTAGI